MNTIKKNAVRQLQTSGRNPLLVDVLPRESFEQEHIPQATNIPVGSDDFVDEVRGAVDGDTSRDIVVYCKDESCDASPRAARKLEEAGFENVHDFAGGIAEWKEAGEPVASGTEE